MSQQHRAHPYIPNSRPEIQAEMLKEIGANSIEDFYADIPEKLRYRQALNLPKAMVSEAELDRHYRQILSKNISTQDYVSFLGAGCSPHHVPAICDEINSRSEFLTAYAGEAYEDYGRFFSLFEYQSLMAELLDMEVVNVPNFDGSQAASTSVRMTQRITNRNTVLISKNISPFKKKIVENYCNGTMTIEYVDIDEAGKVVLQDLKGKLGSHVASFFYENPGFTGVIEDRGQEIADMVHAAGSLVVVGCDPISLGVLEAPVNYGADLVAGDVESLGIHQNFGGGLAGFIGAMDEERFVSEYPTRLFGITDTCKEGEYGFGDVFYDRTSFGAREHGKEFVGTAAALWGITAGVYLSVMGPEGMRELGETVILRGAYARKQMAAIKGLKIRGTEAPHFKEFVVDFSGTGKTVNQINQALLTRKMFGGFDLTNQIVGYENCALFCVTEVHSQMDIDALVLNLKEIVEGA
jgi:glycine dehydrogenase subunit 1